MISKTEKDSKRKQHTKITIVTLSTAISYFILSIPSIIAYALDVYDNKYSYFGKFAYIFEFFITLGTFLTNINAMFDCLIYVVVSSQTWQRFTRVCSGSGEKVIGNNNTENISGNQTTDRILA